MKRLVIADAHVGQRAGDVAAMLALVERTAAAGVGELVYLGDAFQYLIGMSKFWGAAVREVLSAFQQVRRAGCRVVLVEGNRDFFLDERELAELVDWSGRRYEFEAGPRRFRLDHGDRVNRKDFKYLFWASLSKSAPARLWARVLPRSLAIAIVRRTEARLAATNFKFRYRLPEDRLRREAGRAWAEGVDVLLWGHFHRLWRLDDGDRVALVVPAWLGSGTSLLLGDGGDLTLVDERLTPLGELPRMP